MNDFIENFEQYIKNIEIVKEEEPEKYSYIIEIADSVSDIQLSKLIENTANSFERNQEIYLKIGLKSKKRAFIEEQIQLYRNASIKYKRYGVYANATYDKCKPILEEALQYWEDQYNILSEDISSGPQPQNEVIQKRVSQTPKEVKFSDLFDSTYRDKLDVFFTKLEENGLIDADKKWIIKQNINEPAKLYYFLKDKSVIAYPRECPALKCFYNEFGHEVVEKKNDNPRATTRRNAQDAKNSVNTMNFNFLLPWINQK